MNDEPKKKKIVDANVASWNRSKDEESVSRSKEAVPITADFSDIMRNAISTLNKW